MKFTIILFLLSTALWAQRAGLPIKLEPIVGLERVQKWEPNHHTKTRLIYGARLLVGYSLLSLESEYTQGKDDESFAEQDLRIEEKSQRIKLGLRSSFRFATLLRFYLRAGAQASKSEVTRTESGVSETRDRATRVAPYAGTGFSLSLLRNISASGGITVIFTDYPRSGDKEYQSTLGFSVSI